MKKLYILLTLLILSTAVQSQKVVMLHKTTGLQLAFYGNQPLIDAYTAASNDDTIYLPGGSFEAPLFDKRLTIYGAGHYPDSSAATGKTFIVNNVSILSNADSSVFEGIDFLGSISVRDNVNYLILKRNSILSIDYSYTPVSSNNRIEGNVINGNINTTYAANLLLVNNIITGVLISTKNGDVVRNNIFTLTNQQYTLNSCLYTLFENNIFLSTLISFITQYGSNYNTFNNNIFTITPTWGSNAIANNYVNADAATLFINQSGTPFNYLHNYHLQNPGSFTGADGLQCGIYGGTFIYKEGAVPVNPHIFQKNISSATDVNGKLNVNISVAAQNE